MSNLVRHAKFELEAAGYLPTSDDPLDLAIYENTLRIVQAFADCGHSGGSASAHTAMIHQLLQFKALTPLTDNPRDWDEVGPSVWQNRRQSCMFSDNGGLTYYSVDEFRSGWRKKLFGSRGKIYKSQHYPNPQKQVQA